MNGKFVKNFNDLATTSNRQIALDMIETGLDAIDTEKAVSSAVSLHGEILSIQGCEFDLQNFKNIKIVGFGKSSPKAALALEKILGDRISGGIVIGIERADSKYVNIFTGTHPKPSAENAEAGKRIYDFLQDTSSADLVIALVSGGGSALLCGDEDECAQGAKLYDAFLKSGKTITEINTVRKHISLLKGGGLAKVAYEATIIGLIFSDVPGDRFWDVASGPTYKDGTTIKDAEKIIAENNLGEFDLVETPKEDKYFEKVHNFVLVSNKTAVEAMAKKSRDFGLETKIASTDLYDDVDKVLPKIFSFKKDNSVVLSAGEPSIVVKKEESKEGKGGRNLHMGLKALEMNLIDENSLFISLASDGMDNTDAAGALVDKKTVEKAKKLGLDIDDYLNRFDSYSFFQKTGDLIMTGPTGANVSDIMMLLNKK